MFKKKNYKIVVFFLFILILIVFPYEKHIISFFSQSGKGKVINLPKPNSLVAFDWYKAWGGSGEDRGFGLGIDSADNVYVAGSTSSFGSGNKDICLIKYNNLGVQQWERTWGGSLNEGAYGLTIDSSDNIYLVGYTWSFGSDSADICLIKYNNLGVKQWERIWDNQSDVGFDIALDSSENIYIVGCTVPIVGGNKDLCLIKYNTLGVKQWERIWGGPNEESGYGLVIDTSENIYVSGFTMSYGAEESDVCLLKYNNEGNLQWNRTWGGTSVDEGTGITLDSSENIFLTGYTWSFTVGGCDVFLLKYNSTGDYQWHKTWGTTVSEFGGGIFIDASSNFYISGYNVDYISGVSDIFLVKFNSTGIVHWSSTWGEISKNEWGGDAISIDSTSNIFIIGEEETNLGDRDLVLIKYSVDSDEDGLFDWEENNTYFTNPDNPDTDEDLLTDWDEIFSFFTDPNDPDSDDDGLSDNDEVNQYHTNPNNSDSDGDGFSDYDEIFTYNTDPNNPLSNPTMQKILNFIVFIIIPIVGVFSIYFFIVMKKNPWDWEGDDIFGGFLLLGGVILQIFGNITLWFNSISFYIIAWILIAATHFEGFNNEIKKTNLVFFEINFHSFLISLLIFWFSSIEALFSIIWIMVFIDSLSLIIYFVKKMWHRKALTLILYAVFIILGFLTSIYEVFSIGFDFLGFIFNLPNLLLENLTITIITSVILLICFVSIKIYPSIIASQKRKKELKKIRLLNTKEKLMIQFNTIDKKVTEEGLESAISFINDIIRESGIHNISEVLIKFKEKLATLKENQKIETNIVVKINKDIKNAFNMKKQGDFESAVTNLNDCLKLTESLINTPYKREIIKNLHDAVNSIYKDYFKSEIQKGIEARSQQRLSESLDMFKNTVNINDKIHDAYEKIKNSKIIQDQIELTYKNIVKAKIQAGFDLKSRGINNLEESLTYFKELVNYIEGLKLNSLILQQERKQTFDAIDSIYSEIIHEKKLEGIQLLKQKKYNESLKILEFTLRIIEKMDFHNTETKKKNINLIYDAFDQNYLNLIEEGRNIAINYKELKKYEESIDTFNNILLITEKLHNESQKGREIKKIKERINDVYSTQIDEIIMRAEAYRNERKYHESIDLFHRSLEVSNNLSDLLIKEQIINEIINNKDLTYFAMINEKIDEGKQIRAQKRYEESILIFKEAIKIIDKLHDSTVKQQKIDEINEKIDASYFDEIDEKIKNGIHLREQTTFDGALSIFNACLNIVENIHGPNVKNSILKIIKKNIKLTKTEKIKQALHDLGIKYPRLQITEIAEEIKEDFDLIKTVAREMIKNNEIEAKYFESTQSLVFSLEIPERPVTVKAEEPKISKVSETYTQYDKMIKTNPNLKDEIIEELSNYIYGYHALEVEKIYEKLKEKFSIEMNELEFTSLVKENFEGFSIGVNPYKDTSIWIASRMIVPWYSIVYKINQEIKGIPDETYARISFKGLRDDLYFPEQPVTKASKNLDTLIEIIEQCNQRGAFSRNLDVTRTAINVPAKVNLLKIIQNMSNHLEETFDKYWKELSGEIKIQNVEIYNVLSEKLQSIKVSVEKPLIQLIHAHKDKMLPNIKEFHYINKEDWEYFENTYSSWKVFWNKVKKSLKFEKIFVIVFQCPSCNNTYRFLFLQETKFSRIMKIVLKIAPYISEILQKGISTRIIPIKEEKRSEIDKNLRNLLPDEISFLYQTLIGIEEENGKNLAETFIYDENILSLRCFRCF